MRNTSMLQCSTAMLIAIAVLVALLPACSAKQAAIAVPAGAQVTIVCSTRNLDLVRSIGADQVIDYTQEDFTAGGQRAS